MAPAGAKGALLAALAADGRASVEALARAASLSPAQVRQQLAELAGEGIDIRGIVHPSFFGHTALAHLLIEVSGSVDAVAGQLASLPEIPYLTRITGGRHVLAGELRVADRGALAAALVRLRAIDGVESIELDEYLDIVKDAMIELAPASDVTLDDIDRSLLRDLQEDGRVSFAELARRVGLSTASARARVLRLLDAGVVRIGLRQRTRPDAVQLGFHLVGDGDEVGRALQSRTAVSYLATSLGRSTHVGTLHVSSLASAAAELDAVQAIPGVRALHTWTHLQVIKEHYRGALTTPEQEKR
ncbi:MAG: Lrp/AsnC family transcriptional regulator [Microbacterium sp.]